MLDTGNNLVLSVETDRTINLNSSRYFLGVEGDKEVKIIRFQLDRYYCGIDLSVFKSRVNYKLSNGKEYYGEATMADFDEDYIYVEWTLDPSVTSVKGRVDFLVQLTKLDEDGSILKRYNSTMAIGRVEEGLNPEDQLPESMKKDILAIAEDTLTQLKESKIEFDNRLKIISDKQNEIIVRLNATDLKIDNFDNDYETKMNEFHTDYQEKMESFETDYSEKMKSAIKNIEDTSVQSVTNVENAKDGALQNIQNKSTELLNNIDEAENMALKNIENFGEYYQNQINEIQKSEALQDEVLDKLNEEVDLKLTQPYLNNKGENHVVNSDNGLIRDLVIKGNTVQVTTKGYQLFYLPDDTKISNGVTTTIKDGLISCEGTVAGKEGWFDVCGKLNISLKQGIEYTFSINKALSVHCVLKTFEDAGEIDRYIEIGKTSMQFTPDSDISSAYVWIAAPAGTNIDIQFRVQVEKGSTAHVYEPYTGGQPSPSPEYPQKVKGVSEISGKIVGKNLFDINKIKEISDAIKRNDDGSLTITSTSADSSVATKMALKDLADLEIGKTYIISFVTTGKKQIYLNEVKQYWGSDSVLTITQDMLNSNVCLYPKGTSSTDIVSGIQIEEASTATNYQPYQSQSFNYTLSNPLYKLSDTVYDYIDLNKGKIIRNVGVVTFDGSDDEEISKVSDTNINVYQFSRAINSIEKYAKYAKCDSFQIATAYANDLLRNDNKIYAATDSCYLSFDKMNTVEKLKVYLQQNPITVYYQLATPVEEPLPSDLQTLLQSLKSYYPQTNIMFDTEVEPYINFDYKLNLKSWIEDKDNKEIEYDKSVNDIQPYSDSYIEKWFNLMHTGRVYTVKFPLWETSQSPIGEKLDANRGLICEPSTPVYAGQNDYDDIPVFKTFDVNAYVDNDGEVHLTAFKGDENFQDTGKVDVFVLTMSYYEKAWTEDGYWYYSISDSPKPGYTIAKECLKKDGSIRPYALYAKYVAGAIDGQPYSSKGLIPCYYPFETISAYHLVSYCKQRGKYYTGGLMWDYKYIWTRFMLKFANTNSQAVLGGVFDYSFQYPITIAEENVKRVIVSKSNAARYAVGSCVSIGDWGDATSMDRSNKNCHNIARNVKILTIEDIDDSNSALNLDLAEPITTTTTCRVTTMHYLSGYSDEILGRDGSLGADPKSTKYPIVISGIECAVGGYEIPCNAMMNILNASGDREVYITNDATKLSTSTQSIMNTWKKSGMTIKTSKVNNWQYITKMGIDTELGCVLPLAAGESGSGSSTGFGDGLYCDNAAAGQREFLLLGNLGTGSIGGLSYLYADLGFSISGWACLARISIMAVRGE
jgi:hypothetical protein